MKADYQLRHQLYGSQGSMWERQVDDVTRNRIRGIVKIAGNAPELARLDQTVAGALSQGKVLVEDESFKFVDGNFAVVGRRIRDYSHSSAYLSDGSRLHYAYRQDPAESGADAVPTDLAYLTRDFTSSIEADQGTLTADRDWYLVPIPESLHPLVIRGAGDDVYLVDGIDYIVRKGYIAMTDNPAEVLTPGLVRVESAYKKIPAPNSFVLSASPDRLSSRFLAEYSQKTQSLPAFKRAAAEYAGLHVFSEADVVLSAIEVSSGRWVYNMANAGAIEIDYPHTAMLKYQEVSPGYIVSGRFDVVASRYNDTENLKQTVAENWNEGFRLDGILPVNDLFWDGHSLIYMDSTGSDPDSGTPHIRLHFSGEDADISRYWTTQKQHERQTGQSLYDALGVTSLPATLDFWDFLETFYGTQLFAMMADFHTPTINTRLWRFMLDHRPKSCNALFGLDMDVLVSTVLTDASGVPLLDEDGNYIPIDVSEGADCEQFTLAINGNILVHDVLRLGFESCPEEETDALILAHDENPLAHDSNQLTFQV